MQSPSGDQPGNKRKIIECAGKRVAATIQVSGGRAGGSRSIETTGKWANNSELSIISIIVIFFLPFVIKKDRRR
jgi:hypothetical protein